MFVHIWYVCIYIYMYIYMVVLSLAVILKECLAYSDPGEKQIKHRF